MDFIKKFITIDDTNKLEYYATKLKNEIDELNYIHTNKKDKYFQNIKSKRIEYEKDVDNYKELLNKSKTNEEKVRLIPPLKINEDIELDIKRKVTLYNIPNIFTYDNTYDTENIKENQNVINKIKGNILELSESHYIVNICNVTGRVAKDISKIIFEKYPKADIYANKTKRNVGDIFIIDKVINIITQKSPLKPKEPDDTEEKRLKWFEMSLEKIRNKLSDVSIIFPNNLSIKHNEILKEFANNNTDFKINIIN